MDIKELTNMTKEEAHELFLVCEKTISKEQYVKDLKEIYKWISEGKKIIDIYDIFKESGTCEDGLPKLAITKANHTQVLLTRGGNFARPTRSKRGRFTYNITVSLPHDTFSNLKKMTDNKRYIATVPIVPPKLLPKDDLKYYYILWEVEAWDEIELPEDPLLLKRLTKNIFVVLAQWNLSPLEQAIMKGR